MKTTDNRAAMRAKAYPKTTLFVETMCDLFARADEGVYNSDRCEEIEYEPRSGFIPYTDGGHFACLPASIDASIGAGTLPAPVQAIVDRNEPGLIAAWDEAHPATPHAAFYGADAPEDLPPELEEAREAFWDFEHEWWGEGGTYFWKATAQLYAPDNRNNPTPGEWSVYLSAWLNTDLDYGRDYIAWLACYGSNPDQTRGRWEKIMSLARFLKLSEARVSALAEEAIAAMP